MLQALAQQTVLLMGFSFMLGSLFTIFILLVLEMMRSAREAKEALEQDGSSQESPAEAVSDVTDKAA